MQKSFLFFLVLNHTFEMGMVGNNITRMKLFFTVTSSVVIMDTSNKKIIDIREKKRKNARSFLGSTVQY